MRVKLSALIRGDLEAIADYIAQDNPERAVTFIQEIRAEIARIGRNPLLHRLRPEIATDARMAIVGQYVILFRVVGKIVIIERVVYGGRDLPPLLQ
jgi:toxin ParE1/3/4